MRGRTNWGTSIHRIAISIEKEQAVVSQIDMDESQMHSTKCEKSDIKGCILWDSIHVTILKRQIIRTENSPVAARSGAGAWGTLLGRWNCLHLYWCHGNTTVYLYKTAKCEFFWRQIIIDCTLCFVGSKFPDQGSNQLPQLWKCRVLTTGLREVPESKLNLNKNQT